jgi:HK97 family phage major capsid protein
MDRREALAKATLTTSDVSAGLLQPEQARAFVVKIKESTSLANAMKQEIKTSSSGEIDKTSTASRIIRRATENADDGYRAGAAFTSISYQTVKVRLPWEATEDVFHENIEGEGYESTLTSDMTAQFALDLEDLDINGDTAAGIGPDQAFLQIDDGILKKLVVAGTATHQVNAAAILAGDISIEHFFAMYSALPNRYRAALRSQLRWIMSPGLAIRWWENLALRTGVQADALFTSKGGPATAPLGIPILEVSAMPEDRMILVDPRNFVRVVSWQIRKRRLTGETSEGLALRDKRLYLFFLKRDVIIEELDAVVYATGFAA